MSQGCSIYGLVSVTVFFAGNDMSAFLLVANTTHDGSPLPRLCLKIKALATRGSPLKETTT